MKHQILALCVGSLLAGSLQAQDLASLEKAQQYLKVCQLKDFSADTDSLYAYITKVADSAIDQEGNLVNFTKGQLERFAIGPLMTGLYAHTQDAKYKKASNWLHHYLVMTYPRNKKTVAQNIFTYQEDKPYQYQLDGLSWGAGFLAGWLGAFDARNTNGWSDMSDQFTLLNTQTRNAATGLNYTTWISDTDKDDTEGLMTEGLFKGCLPQFQALSMARMFTALVDAIECIPVEQPDKIVLTNLACQMAEGLMNWQDAESGTWSVSLIDKPEEVDYPATALLLGSYCKALRLKILPDKDYKDFTLQSYDKLKPENRTLLLDAEYNAWKKSMTPAKKPVPRRPAARPASKPAVKK